MAHGTTSNFDIHIQDSQDMDEELWESSQRPTTSQDPTKRKAEEELNSESKILKSSTETELEFLDPEKTLAIFAFIDDQEKDPIVREYAEKILELGCFPVIPNGDSFNLSEPVTPITITKNCSAEVVETIMNFFRINYFKNNMIDATANNKSVMSVQAKLNMPCFQTYPLKTHDSFAKIKHSAAIQIQSLSAEGAKFNAELMCIRSAHLLFTEIKNSIDKDDAKIAETTQFHFQLHFRKASMEFVRKFNIKKIDWENFISKVRIILPKWRREDTAPPQSLRNNHATDIIARIKNDQEKFDLASIKSEYENFLKDGEAAVQRMKQSGKLRFPEPNANTNRPQLSAFRRHDKPQNNSHDHHVPRHQTRQNYSNNHQAPPPRNRWQNSENRGQRQFNHHPPASRRQPTYNKNHSHNEQSNKPPVTPSNASLHQDVPSLLNRLL